MDKKRDGNRRQPDWEGPKGPRVLSSRARPSECTRYDVVENPTEKALKDRTRSPVERGPASERNATMTKTRLGRTKRTARAL